MFSTRHWFTFFLLFELTEYLHFKYFEITFKSPLFSGFCCVKQKTLSCYQKNIIENDKNVSQK